MIIYDLMEFGDPLPLSRKLHKDKENEGKMESCLIRVNSNVNCIILSVSTIFQIFLPLNVVQNRAK